MKLEWRGASRGAWMGLLLSGLGALGCESRSEAWDVPFNAVRPITLEGSVALHDQAAARLIFVTAPDEGKVESRSFPLGKNVRTITASPDKKWLYVLSEGEYPRRNPDDEKPRLQIFEAGTDPAEHLTVEFDDPMDKLSLDPQGEWLALFSGTATVTNENQIVLVSLGDEPKVTSKTIRSYGGSPLELTFTDELLLPSGERRRFLLSRSDRDVTLVDLSDLERKEITVGLTENEEDVPFAPAQIVYDDGDPEDPNDARLAVRLEGTRDVVVVDFAPPLEADREFFLRPNIVDAGGVPSTIDFVRTDGGLRLAALVPSRSRVTLIDPEESAVELVDLGGAYTHMTRITSVVSETPEDGDVALLWGAGNRFAFWSLGGTSSAPYRSVDVTELDVDLNTVLDVPAPNQHLKVIVGSNQSKIYVLDLKRRESSPLRTRSSGFGVEVASDGGRLWVYRPGAPEFSAVGLPDLRPVQLYVDPSPQWVADIARGDGGRAVLALRYSNSLDVTLLDANEPDSAKTTYFPALHIEGIE